MNLQSDFRNVTNRIIGERRALAEAEQARMAARGRVANAEANLNYSRTFYMAQPEAGTNDHQRRLYVQSQPAIDGLALDLHLAEKELLAAEGEVLTATTELRCAEDERRFVELVAKLAVAGVGDAADGEAETAGEVEDVFAF